MTYKYLQNTNMHTAQHDSEEIIVYLLVCKNKSGAIVVPPFTAFDESEALNYFEENSCEPGLQLYEHELLRVLKAFIIQNGQVVWANREGIDQEEARYIAIDFGCHGIPNVYFRTLLQEEEIDLESTSIARIC